MADNNNTPKNTLKQWFVTGAKPQQAQYWSWLDSYWHKSESIPINKIEGIETLIENKADVEELALYAKKDAGNIDVPLWKQKLGVGELPANVGTIDYVSPSGDVMIGNSYKKVANPGDGRTYVLNIDGTAVSVDTFGKNITNSSNTTTGSYIQTQRASDTFDWETNGARYAIKSLPDKSADASFIDILGKNSVGQLAKIGYPAFKANVTTWTQEQALEFSQILNGGVGSAGLMSVNTISPPLFERENNNVYLVLRGANLYLNTQSMSIQILKASDNTVVATVPNSQIQLYADGLSLVFYYNFYNLGADIYKLKITSGAKTLITTLNFQIVSQIESINIAAITWNKLVDSTYITNDISTGSGSQVNLAENKLTQITANPVISFLSSEIFNQGDDWYIEMQVTCGNIQIGVSAGGYTASEVMRIGICYSNIQNSLSFIPIHFWRYFKTWNGGSLSSNINPNTNSINYTGQSTNSKTFVLSITKISNLLTITDGSQVGFVTISNNSGYSLSAQLKGIESHNYQTGQIESPSIIITKAFKIL